MNKLRTLGAIIFCTAVLSSGCSDPPPPPGTKTAGNDGGTVRPKNAAEAKEGKGKAPPRLDD